MKTRFTKQKQALIRGLFFGAWVDFVLHTGDKSKPRNILDRVLAAVTVFLNCLYPDSKRPTIAQRNATIRARYQAGERQAALAREYGISYQRIFQIVRGES